MPCPVNHDDIDDDDPSTESRRSFLKAAVAIGGTSAMAACAEYVGSETGIETTVAPIGPKDLSTLPERQHVWGKYLPSNRGGVVTFPLHQVFVFLEYTGDGQPTAQERAAVEQAFQTLERAYARGAGADPDSVTADGLLFSIAYSRTYFDRFDEDLPAGLDFPSADELLSELDETEPTADEYDAVIHLASDNSQVVLGAESALFGEIKQVNGVEVEGGLNGVFERPQRRSGVVGRGQAKRKLDFEEIPEGAPISMGFQSAFADALPSEDKVTIENGPFAGGSIQQISRLEIDLNSWYDQSHEARVEKMFSPHHSSADVGEFGENLGNDSGVTEEVAEQTVADAEETGRVGHGQKLARVRDDDFDPIILRRGDFFDAFEDGSVLHFGALQSEMEDFVETRKAMDEIDDDVSLPEEEDGILHTFDVTNRATFLMPRRADRALPSPNPDRA